MGIEWMEKESTQSRVLAECPFCPCKVMDFENFTSSPQGWDYRILSGLPLVKQLAIGCLAAMVAHADIVGSQHLRKQMRQLISYGQISLANDTPAST